jgi:hypothetical protein
MFFKFAVPEVFASLDTFHKTMLSTYVFFKPFETTFTIDCNATPQHSGIVRLWYDPRGRFIDGDTPPAAGSYAGSPLPMRSNIWTTSGQPHVDLQVADSEPASLTIPFEHMQNCLSTNSDDPVTTMGVVRCMVIAPLQATPTSSSVITFQMWMSFSNIDLAVPIWPHTPRIPSLIRAEVQSQMVQQGAQIMQQIPQQISQIPQQLTQMVPQMPSAPPPAPKSWWEKGLGLLSGVAGTVFNGMTGNWSGAISSGVGTISELLMDKPNDPMRAVNNMLYPVGPLAHTQGVGTHVRLDASPMGGQTDNDFSMMDPIEQKLGSIAKIPMLAYKFDWSSEQAPDTVLMRIPVAPGLCAYESLAGNVIASDGVTTVNANYINLFPTFLYKVASMFRFWSGTIKYHFQFAMTGIHTGKLLVTFVPNNYSPTGQTFAQTTNANSAIFDVAGQKDFDFAPEWVSTIPRKSFYDWSSTPYALVDDRYLTGWLEVRVATRLTLTNAVSTSIPAFVYISAGDDFFCESLMRDPWLLPSGFIPYTTTVAPIRAEVQSDVEEKKQRSPNDEIRHLLRKNNNLCQGIIANNDKIKKLLLVTAEVQSETAPAEDQAEHQIEKETDRVNNTEAVLPQQMTNVAVGDIRDCMRRANYLGVIDVVLRKVIPQDAFYQGFQRINVNPSYCLGSAVDVPNFGPPRAVFPGNPNPSQDFCANISNMYTFWSGTIDYTFVPYFVKKMNLHMKATFYPVGTDDVDHSVLPGIYPMNKGFLSSMASHLTTIDQQNCLQVSCPFTSNYTQLDLNSAPASELSCSGLLMLEISTIDINGLPTVEIDEVSYPYVPVELYRTLGDDGRLSWLVAPGSEQILMSLPE